MLTGPSRPRVRAVFASLVIAVLSAAAIGLVRPSTGQTPPAPTLPGAIAVLSANAPSDHAGSLACANCHAREFAAWASSHHAVAMAEATVETVRGDFADATVEVAGSRGRFFRDASRFLVETDDSSGRPATFAVTHVFGHEPLQQYLVTFPDGRLQALPWAWDTRPAAAGGQRWFHVYGSEPIGPSDSRHWTRSQQTWNYMCAECHSTALDKGYDPAANTYRTTWSEISVGCEACHGAGRAHVSWARDGASAAVAGKGFASGPARRGVVDWTPDAVTGSPPASVARPAGDEVAMCARCHSRRGQISPTWTPGRPLTDTHLPSLLTPDLFEDDGQMKDEVFNDHSFRQSLMYARGVTCGDCHDAHSGRLRATGATVCAQCHAEERFGTAAHSGHPAGPGQPDCIGCHMPARLYMVVDRRHDHSFRIPRPDLSVTLGTPNACNDCHKDRPAAWAAAAVERWHGPVRKGHQTFAAAFRAARLREPAAGQMLLAIAEQKTVPAVARATAIAALAAWPSASAEAVAVSALNDPDPLVRVAAIRNQEGQPPDVRWRRLSPALADPVLAVRLAAGAALADRSPSSVGEGERPALLAAFAEVEAAHRLDADRAEGRAALGTFRQRQGRFGEAEAEYLAALRLEPSAVAVSVNLADLYRQQGREDAAQATLRAALALSPDAAAAHHALGLSLVRARRLPDAMPHLADAARLDPANTRFAFVHGVALQSTNQAARALEVWRDALTRNPSDVDILSALLQQALRSGDNRAAAGLARQLSQLRPDDAELARLAARLRP